MNMIKILVTVCLLLTFPFSVHSQVLRDLRRNNSSVSAGLRADFDKPLAQSRKASYLRF